MAKAFGPDEQGELAWRCTRQRFGGIPKAMRQRLGGETYELPEPSEEPVSDDGRFRPTVLMERVSKYIEGFPGRSQREIREANLGKREATVVEALRALIDEGYVETRTRAKQGGGTEHVSVSPYREAEDEQATLSGGGEDE